jgi:hypothetical protein
MRILQAEFELKRFLEFQEIETLTLVLQWSDQAVMDAVEMVGVGSQGTIALKRLCMWIRARMGRR